MSISVPHYPSRYIIGEQTSYAVDGLHRPDWATSTRVDPLRVVVKGDPVATATHRLVLLDDESGEARIEVDESTQDGQTWEPYSAGPTLYLEADELTMAQSRALAHAILDACDRIEAPSFEEESELGRLDDEGDVG